LLFYLLGEVGGHGFLELGNRVQRGVGGVEGWLGVFRMGRGGTDGVSLGQIALTVGRLGEFASCYGVNLAGSIGVGALRSTTVFSDR
jgi:hypothetical protein